jgi:hypothetical protein
MGGSRRPRHTLPNTRTVTIIAQDPSVRLGGCIVTAEVQVPAEELLPGPCGHRVNVIDYDVTANVLYQGAVLPPISDAGPPAVAAAPMSPDDCNRAMLEDPRFHAQNVYGIVMRTLARFEFALGRRIAWGSGGHQLHVAPHAFAEPNAFYSRDDRGLFFGYFTGLRGQPVFACLSHDVVAHETTHAILDGLRARYMEPSSPDQAAFHEGFADVVALLSVFSLPGVIEAMLDMNAGGDLLIDEALLTCEMLKQSVLMGLADEMGAELSGVRGDALRRSVELAPGLAYMSMEAFQEPHRRGELLVAAVMNAMLDMWQARLRKIGFIEGRKRDRSLVVEEGARVADHLLTMTIRAIDYCPPTDLTFADYLSALLTVDREVVPDDSKYGYRDALLKSFEAYDIRRAAGSDEDGTWRYCDQELVYARTHFDSMLRDREEVFRFLWENRTALEIDDDGYLEVQSVRPCTRVGPDGFVLRETVAEYIQILTLTAGELKEALGVDPPGDLPSWKRLRVFGGGALIFDEYGRLKHHVANGIARTAEDVRRQTARLDYLWASGFFDRAGEATASFAALHLARATR